MHIEMWITISRVISKPGQNMTLTILAGRLEVPFACLVCVLPSDSVMLRGRCSLAGLRDHPYFVLLPTCVRHSVRPARRVRRFLWCAGRGFN